MPGRLNSQKCAVRISILDSHCCPYNYLGRVITIQTGSGFSKCYLTQPLVAITVLYGQPQKTHSSTNTSLWWNIGIISPDPLIREVSMAEFRCVVSSQPVTELNALQSPTIE